MTTEEKIEKILEEVLMKHHDDISSQDNDAIAEATRDILALIKPMSRERLIKLIADYKCGYPFVHSDGDSYIGDENAEGISDTILAEWEKKL